MPRVDELLREARRRLAPVSDTAALDAELLLAGVLERDRTFLFTWPEQEPADTDVERFREWIARREAGEPVAYLLGEREFHGHRFRVTPDTLIPRPETELLVDTVLALVPDEPCFVVDAGTGSGAVGISLALARSRWQVLLTDANPATLAVAADNAQRLGAANVTTRRSDWLEKIAAPVDVLVSNPPYVAEADPHLDTGDVRQEPRGALAAGADGLDAIRELIDAAPVLLAPGGWLVLEHGYEQGEAVRALMAAAGLESVTTVRDLAGHERVSYGCTHVR